MIWHSATASQVVEELNSHPTEGLSQLEAEARLRQYGRNEVADKHRKRFGQVFAAQFKSPTLIILLLAAVAWIVAGLLLDSGNLWGGLLIIGTCLLGALIDTVKHYRAEQALDSLRNLTRHTVKVIREGGLRRIAASQVVPGDVMLLEEGDYIAADARLLTADGLRCGQKAITGDELSAEKAAVDGYTDIVPIEKRANMVYAGCTVDSGSATCMVVATGMDTESAKIALVVADSLRITTPLQREWRATARSIGLAAVLVSVAIFALGMILADGNPFERFGATFMACAALATSAVPESLAATITTVLAVGVSRMVRKKVLVGSLSAVETLGKVSVICTDKTGTLTQNHMTMTRMFTGRDIIFLDQNPTLSKATRDLLLMGAMCCDADVVTDNGNEWIVGDHTEAGMVAAACRHVDIDKATLDSMYPRLCQLPFDADRKLKTSVNMIEGRPVAVVKGAPDILISRCNNCDQKTAIEAAAAMAEDALRVIGIGYRFLDEVPTNPTQEELEYNLTFGALVGLADPPMPEIASAIDEARGAGIRVIMMTGDHISTAVSSAKQLGVMTTEDSVITNDELAALSDEELAGVIHRFSVFVRLTPDNKLRVVRALQQAGEVVAITGDRVEDAPVLRAADVGCAMGQSGTDIARRAADLTIADDKFSTILAAIGAGRGIYDNLGKAIRLALGFVFSIGVVMLVGLIGTGVLPLNGVQIMCLNLLVSVASVLPFALEKPTKGLLGRPPRTDDRIFDKRTTILSLIHASLLSIASVIAYVMGYAEGSLTASTMAFAVLGFGQLLYGFCARSRYSLLDFRRHHLNLWLMLAALAAGGGLMLILNVEGLNTVFGMTALGGSQITAVAVLSLAPFLVTEGLKLLRLLLKK